LQWLIMGGDTSTRVLVTDIPFGTVSYSDDWSRSRPVVNHTSKSPSL
jgi:hypothetical protein